MATLLLFGPARGAAGEPRVTIEAASLVELCEVACQRFGRDFEAVLRASALWLNGEPVVGDDTAIGERDEVAVVPPVSGGA